MLASDICGRDFSAGRAEWKRLKMARDYWPVNVHCRSGRVIVLEI